MPKIALRPFIGRTMGKADMTVKRTWIGEGGAPNPVAPDGLINP
jgi:hypothetical protein